MVPGQDTWDGRQPQKVAGPVSDTLFIWQGPRDPGSPDAFSILLSPGYSR